MTDASTVPAASRINTVTGVFAVLTPKPGIQREQVMAVMPEEIRATVRLYLAGKIREWYSRGDGRGAVFLLDAKTVEEAEAILEPLPLARAHLVDHNCIPVGPLMALGLFVPDPAQA
jgi:hypothetical protein